MTRHRSAETLEPRPVISVVVPVFNAAPYLERVIGALLAQDFPPEAFELIFVDNGSGDDSRSILERQRGIRFLSQPEPGSYAARNRGVREARGEIVAFTDSDCFPVRGWLSAIDRAFRRSAAHVLLGPRVPAVGHSRVRLVSEYENRKAELVCASNDPMLYFGYTNNMAVRRPVLDRYGPFVERARGSDTIFVRRVVDELSCAAVAYCPEMCVQHAELDSISAYYSKVRTYGRSRKAYRHITAVRPLSLKERLQAFRSATRRYPVVDTVLLFALLVGGSVAWWSGGLRARSSDS